MPKILSVGVVDDTDTVVATLTKDAAPAEQSRLKVGTTTLVLEHPHMQGLYDEIGSQLADFDDSGRGGKDKFHDDPLANNEVEHVEIEEPIEDAGGVVVTELVVRIHDKNDGGAAASVPLARSAAVDLQAALVLLDLAVAPAP